MFIDEVIKDCGIKFLPEGIFKIQNVAEYVYSDEKEYFDESEDLFNCYLPFEKTWMEFKMPEFSNSEGKIVRLDSANSWWGIFGENFIDSEKKLNLLKLSFFTDLFKRSGRLDKIRFNGTITLGFGNDGLFIPIGEKDIIIGFNEEDLNYEEVFNLMNKGQTPAMLVSGGSNTVIYMFLNFLSCKNVIIIPEYLTGKLIKSRKKKNKSYFERFYTLQIEPMKKILKKEGNSETLGIKRALHICRGHFATYDEKGLFGKYYGKFWIPAHTKGSKKIGKINKDYEVIVDHKQSFLSVKDKITNDIRQNY